MQQQPTRRRMPARHKILECNSRKILQLRISPVNRPQRGSKNPLTQQWVDDDEYSEFVSDENDGLNRLVEADRKKYITLAISKLKQQDQLIITLHYIAGKSITEITEIMEMKSSEIKMRLLRSREKLERELVRLLKNEINEL